MTTPSAHKYRPLLLAAIALVLLPFLVKGLGLSLNTGIMVVGLAIAVLGLNLCVGYTGLVSFGHIDLVRHRRLCRRPDPAASISR